MRVALIPAISLFLAFICTCNTPPPSAESSAGPAGEFPLKAYVEEGDEAFRYELAETVPGDGWTEYRIRMVSGTWLTPAEVDHPEWWHWLTVVVPEDLRETGSMMIIGGGSSHDSVPLPAENWQIEAAVATRSVISHVSNIPFQPIDFKGDNRDGRYEDDLIAFGWDQFLTGGADSSRVEWLARFPMTRAVVRAMDVVQEITAYGPVPVQEFFVTGASKRGWTTWTTAAVDERVMGMAPIVIDLLNIVPSFRHHWRCYGEWSPAVDDYVEQGIMEWMETDEFRTLLETVEPYSFVDRITIPKLIVNATADEFFVTDSWQFYWDDLRGPSYLQYIPNGNHGLRGTYQPRSLIAFYRATISDDSLPEFSWDIRSDTLFMKIEPGTEYKIRLWQAVNPGARDFRIYVTGEGAWKMETLEQSVDGQYAVPVKTPESGYRAALLEVIFRHASQWPLTFTSGTLVLPGTYPFGPFVPDS